MNTCVFSCYHGAFLTAFTSLLYSHFHSLVFEIRCSKFFKPFTGAIIQSTLSEVQTTTHAALLSQLTSKASSIIHTLDVVENDDNGDDNNDDNNSGSGGDELTFLRIRSKKKEILIAPDNEFLMVVIQNPNAGVGL